MSSLILLLIIAIAAVAASIGYFLWKGKNGKQKKTAHINIEALRERQEMMKAKGKCKGGRVISVTPEQAPKQTEAGDQEESESEDADDEQVRRKTGALVEANEGNTISKVNATTALKHPSTLVSCSADKSVSITKLTENGNIDKNSTTIIDSCDTPAKVVCANDKYIAYGTKAENLTCYNRELKKYTKISLSSPVSCVRLFGDIAIIGTEDGQVMSVNLPKEQIIRTFQAHNMSVTGIDFYENNIYTCSTEQIAREFNSDCQQTTIYSGHNEAIADIFATKSYVITGSVDETICVWERKPTKDFTEDDDEEFLEDNYWNENDNKNKKRKHKQKQQKKSTMESEIKHSRVIKKFDCPEGCFALAGIQVNGKLKFICAGCGDGSIRIFNLTNLLCVIESEEMKTIRSLSVAWNTENKFTIYSGDIEGNIKTTTVDITELEQHLAEPSQPTETAAEDAEEVEQTTVLHKKFQDVAHVHEKMVCSVSII